MAPLLSLTVRISPTDSFEVSIEEAENVEALSAVIMSMRPDLGEELRIVHKGRPLRPEQVLQQAGIAPGDAVAVARKASAAKAEAQAVASTSEKPIATSEPETASAEPPASCDAAEEMLEASKVEESGSIDAEAALTRQPSAGASSAPSDIGELARQSSDVTTAAPSDVPAEEDQQEVADDEPPQKKSKGADLEGLDDMTPSAAILAVLQQIEKGGMDGHPAELQEALRRTASRVEALERALGESHQALLLLNHLSARALQGLGNAGEGGLPAGSLLPSPEREEAPKSFMIKKGDCELQEAHRLAAQAKATKTPQGGYGGTLSSSASPMTKEEMDKARQARLERLEAQQARLKQEQDEAAARSRAKESLFNTLAGPAKQLGKP
eukprot:TRINITY_DN48888_c0_g1_i1.p1 TRINITY_DN48888_c0_g1~~TRINITY_DN48888_c0_g1_i1.p1  ORF type:complete len:383 (+),score=105.75 TRINITY_DN48888_c0_g1_i1:58-1206(+)